MTSSPSSFANAGKLQVLPTPTTLLFTSSMNNNNLTINNMATNPQNLRQTVTQHGTILQQQMTNGTMTTPTSIVRVNQHQTMQQVQHMSQNQGQFTQQTVWTNATPQSSQHLFTLQKAPQQTPIVHYATVKNEPCVPIQQAQQQQTSILSSKVNTQPVIRQTVGSHQTTVYTESQINDLVSKCRTFLSTLLRLAEKQAPEKLPMVRSCIQELLDGTIDPEAFTQQLHTLYKSQPHTSLVPFFRLALPHMRQIVRNRFGCSITIELLEQLQLPPPNNSNNNNNNSNNAAHMTTVINAAPQNQMVNNNTVVNQSIINQQQHLTSIVQQPLYTTVQTQQKINIIQSPSQPTLIGTTGSLLSQQQQQQQQARTQSSIAGIRPLVTSISASANPSILGVQQQQHSVQSLAQRNIQLTDSLLQRSVLSSATAGHGVQQPQIITVNHQPIKTEAIHTQPTSAPSIASIQQKNMIKTEEDYVDDHNHSNLAETRHLAHDDRLIHAMPLRRRFRELAERDKRFSGVSVIDDATLSLISNAAQERLKSLVEQFKLIAQHRIDLSMKNDPIYQQTSDVKSQIRFLEDLDKIEKQKKDKMEQEKIFRAAKSRSKTNDPEAAQLKKKAKEIHMAQVEEQRQKEANETALAAIGKPKKRKLEESTNHIPQGTNLVFNGAEQISPIQPSPSSGAVTSTTLNSKTRTTKRICRANLRDLLLIMERDKCLKRSQLLVRALNK